MTSNTTVTVLIPAHNEEASIGYTLGSLLTQTRVPNHVIVVADNCTDDTEAVSASHGAEVFKTIGNTKKKAGALNQALKDLLPNLGDEDFVLIMDADTKLSPAFIEKALKRLVKDKELGAVGGVFYGDEGAGILGQFQRNEYTRYAREIERKRGRVMVLSGTSAVFRPDALRDVAKNRGDILPGIQGDVYDTLALTEDNEITLALKTLRWKLVSPSDCSVVTEIMPTWGDLWRQRIRWQRGALENLLHYGWTPVTRRYWFQQSMLAFGVLALGLYMTLLLITVIVSGGFHINPVWAAIGGIFVLEKTVTVWRGGWGARLLAIPLLIEVAYDIFIQVVFIYSVLQIVFKREATWGHAVAPRRVEIV